MEIGELYQKYLETGKVSTDTRQITSGSVFFALRGPAFNGNEFATEAIAKGARYAVVDDPRFASDPRCLLVEDSLEALQNLARHHRKQLTIDIIGLTGSNGKTTTKELVYAVLSKKFKTWATRGNLNNHIGVPLTILYQLNNSTRDEIRANLKLIFATPALQNNETFVDQFMTQRVVTNDGYTINSLIESIKRKEDFLDSRLSEIKKPTLIIWGKQDGLIPVADAATFNKGIANSELVIFDNCGHVPQVEKALDFNKKVLEFLGK